MWRIPRVDSKPVQSFHQRILGGAIGTQASYIRWALDVKTPAGGQPPPQAEVRSEKHLVCDLGEQEEVISGDDDVPLLKDSLVSSRLQPENNPSGISPCWPLALW